MTRRSFVIDPDSRYLDQFSSHRYAWSVLDENNNPFKLGGFNAAGAIRTIERIRDAGRKTTYLRGVVEGIFTIERGLREDAYRAEGQGGPIIRIEPHVPLISGSDGEAVVLANVAVALAIPSTLSSIVRQAFEMNYTRFTEARFFPSSGRLDFH